MPRQNRAAAEACHAEGGAERTFQLRLQLAAKRGGSGLGLLAERRQLRIAQSCCRLGLADRGRSGLQSSVLLHERTLAGRLHGAGCDGSARERVALEASRQKATPGRAQPPRALLRRQAACDALCTHQLRARVLQLRVQRLDVRIAARDALLAETKRSLGCSSGRACCRRLRRARFAQRVQLGGRLIQLRGQRADVAAREGAAADAPVFRLGQAQRADQRTQLRQQAAGCGRRAHGASSVHGRGRSRNAHRRSRSGKSCSCAHRTEAPPGTQPRSLRGEHAGGSRVWPRHAHGAEER